MSKPPRRRISAANAAKFGPMNSGCEMRVFAAVSSFQPAADRGKARSSQFGLVIRNNWPAVKLPTVTSVRGVCIRNERTLRHAHVIVGKDHQSVFDLL